MSTCAGVFTARASPASTATIWRPSLYTGMTMSSWGVISGGDELGLLPPPLAGEGWGGGCLHTRYLFACPLPVPPPQAGEGNTPSARYDRLSSASESRLRRSSA